MVCRVLVWEIIIFFLNLGILVLISIFEVEYFIKLGLVEFCIENIGIYVVFGIFDL